MIFFFFLLGNKLPFKSKQQSVLSFKIRVTKPGYETLDPLDKALLTFFKNEIMFDFFDDFSIRFSRKDGLITFSLLIFYFIFIYLLFCANVVVYSS
jgi:hypothetical protein